MRGRFFLTVVELTTRVLMGGSFLSCWANSSCTAEANESLPAGETAAQDLKIKANQLRQAGRTSGTFVQGELQR